jgi:hypothetical protein
MGEDIQEPVSTIKEQKQSLSHPSSSPPLPARRFSCLKCFAYTLLGILTLTGGILSLLLVGDEDSSLSLSPVSSSLGLKRSQDGKKSSSSSNDGTNEDERSGSRLPDELFDLGLYQESDFVNEIGISPPFWKPKPGEVSSGRTWGPCFPQTKSTVDWVDDRNNTEYKYVHGNPTADKRWMGPAGGKSGLCRPGFIILGAGKCGTSSLYHYLLGHPRVAPAFEKQIHYFIVRCLLACLLACLLRGCLHSGISFDSSHHALIILLLCLSFFFIHSFI